MPSEVRLYAMPISHWCVSADRMLAFKGIPFETVYVPYHDKRELIAVSGQDYVPTLVTDDNVVMWYEIPGFLERERPDPTLYPDDWQGVATTIEQWSHAILEEKVWRYVVTRVPPVLRDDHERWVFEEMQVKARGPWDLLEKRQEEFREGMLEEFKLVDAMLANREWILGKPSLADFGIYGSISPLFTIGESIPKEFSNLSRWATRIQALG